MQTRIFALVFGILFLAAGILGFIPGLLTAPDREIAVTAMHGKLFGLFPVNVIHNLVHIGFGIWGLVAYRSLDAAALYGKVTAVVYAILVVMGLIPVLDTAFGLTPLYGHDVWLHAGLAIVAGYFGFYHGRVEAGQLAARKM